jgi:hypothetical protein
LFTRIRLIYISANYTFYIRCTFIRNHFYIPISFILYYVDHYYPMISHLLFYVDHHPCMISYSFLYHMSIITFA